MQTKETATCERRNDAGAGWSAAWRCCSSPRSGRSAQDAQPRAQVGERTTHSRTAKPSFEIYGFAMLDIGHDFKQINPNWFDTMRVTKLPSFEDQFGEDHNTFAGVRQSRLGVRSTTPTALGDLKTTFEFELFGTGVDEGQTTFRLRHAYGELGAVRRRPDLEPVHGSGRVPELARVLGTDRHGVLPQRAGPLDADQGRRANLTLAARAAGRQRRRRRLLRTASSCRTSRPAFPLPDFSGRLPSTAQDWGYVRAAGMLRSIKWDDVLDDQFDLVGRRDRLGHQPQLEPQGGHERRRPPAVRRSARASRTT